MSARLNMGLVALALLASVPAAANTAAGDFAVEGVGGATCKQFTAAQKAKGEIFQRMMGFVDGYLTAANRYEPNTFDLAAWHSDVALSLILGAHCAKFPAESLSTSLQRLVIGLKPMRVAEKAELVAIENGGKTAKVYPPIVRRAQQALKAKGLYAGPDDSRYSPALKAALLKFQANSKLEQTGIPDVATLWTLLNP